VIECIVVDPMDCDTTDLETRLFWIPKDNSLHASIPAEWVGRDIVFMFNGEEQHQQGHLFEDRPVIRIHDPNAKEHHGNTIFARLNPLF
jgi:hypothetical protein